MLQYSTVGYIYGAIAMLLSMGAHVFADALIKGIMLDHGLFSSIAIRYFFRALPYTIILIAQLMRNQYTPVQNKPFMGLRVLIGFGMAYSFSTAIYFMPPGSITLIRSIAQIAPILAIILAVTILKEQVSKKIIIAIAIALMGLSFIIRFNVAYTAIGMLFCLLGVLFVALNKVVIRKISSTETWLNIALCHNLFIFGTSFTIAMRDIDFSIFLNQKMTLYFLFVGIVDAFAQFASIYALKHTTVTRLAPLDYSALVWSILFDYTLWGKVHDHYTLIGVVIIAFSSLLCIKK